MTYIDYSQDSQTYLLLWRVFWVHTKATQQMKDEIYKSEVF